MTAVIEGTCLVSGHGHITIQAVDGILVSLREGWVIIAEENAEQGAVPEGYPVPVVTGQHWHEAIRAGMELFPGGMNDGECASG